ncbi:hypothetical protein C8R44DRAFT_881476 [Mycena epipterygia]|nr:hypothetical protein C8R44DRAFT_881476 [Mycena epipterygia]
MSLSRALVAGDSVVQRDARGHLVAVGDAQRSGDPGPSASAQKLFREPTHEELIAFAGRKSAIRRRIQMDERSEAERQRRFRRKLETNMEAPAPGATRIIYRDATAIQIARDGYREPREDVLMHEDLWIGDARPPDLSTTRMHQQCGICHFVKSHPVSYRCGHSHCYVCIRMWLEKSWSCPECVEVMHEAPFRHYAEEAGLVYDFPDVVDESEVDYNWEDLIFPKRLKIRVVDEDD